MKDTKPRRPFILLDERGVQIGRGTYYEEGNVQSLHERPPGSRLANATCRRSFIEGCRDVPVGHVWTY